MSTIADKPLVWTLVALWAALIFALSSSTFARARTAVWLDRAVAAFSLPLSRPSLDAGLTIARSSAHVVEYFVLMRLLKAALRTRFARAPLWALAGAALYAVTDEVHQIFVPGRTASISDCALDCFGAALALFPFVGR